MERTNPVSQDTIASKALEALQKAKNDQEENKKTNSDDITSLNKLLQWSTANSDPNANVAGPSEVLHKTAEDLEKDREWLDAAFPDMFAEIKGMVRMLTEEKLDDDMTVEVLEGLQEYFMDLNYAVNIDKIGALDAVLRCAESDSADVRATAVWVIGTAMQDLQEVKDLMMAKEAHVLLTERLKEDNAKVRAKAVMASSALIRHSSEDMQSKFKQVGGMAILRRLLSDDNVQVRRRARFFLQHAPATGNSDFVADLLVDRNAMVALSSSIEELDVEDVADVEAAVGALDVLVESDKQGLLQVAPELPGILDALAAKAEDFDLKELLTGLAGRVG